MIEYRFSLKHEGCWTATFNDEFPGLTATILHSHAFSDSSSTMIEVPDVSEGTADDVVAWLRSHPIIESTDLLEYERAQRTAIVRLQADYSDSDTDPAHNVLKDTDCFPLTSAKVRNGYEHGALLMRTEEQAKEVHEGLAEYGPITVNSLSEFDLNYPLSDFTEIAQVIGDLSGRQKEVLLRAIEAGYYDSPRSCTVEELAEGDDASMSTVAEHLRLAEANVVKSVRPLLDGSPSER